MTTAERTYPEPGRREPAWSPRPEIRPEPPAPAALLGLQTPAALLDENTARRDIDALLRTLRGGGNGNGSRLDVGTAIATYRDLLQMAGKPPAQVWPYGFWHTYTAYRFRDDTARMVLETDGLDQRLGAHGLTPSPAARLTGLLLAGRDLLHGYDALLAMFWRERGYMQTLLRLAAAGPYQQRVAHLVDSWAIHCPPARGADVAAGVSYARFRRRRFDAFLEHHLQLLPSDLQQAWLTQVQRLPREQRDRFVQQLSICSFQEPGRHSERQIGLAADQCHVGLVLGGRYYLLPSEPSSPQALLSSVRRLLHGKRGDGDDLGGLAAVSRDARADLVARLNPGLRTGLALLQRAPLLIAADGGSGARLAQLRDGARATGDQPLTIRDSGRALLFDAAPAYFDPAWAATIANLYTEEALSWITYLESGPQQRAEAPIPLRPVALPWQPLEKQWLRQAPRPAADIAVENSGVQWRALEALRRLMGRRRDLRSLDTLGLFLLYRAAFGAAYEPARDVHASLAALQADPRTRVAATTALAALQPNREASLLVPLETPGRVPQRRMTPLLLTMPLDEWDFVAEHQHVVGALQRYATADRDGRHPYQRFDDRQRAYLRHIAGFTTALQTTRAALAGVTSARAGENPLPPGWLIRHADIVADSGAAQRLREARELVIALGPQPAGGSVRRFLPPRDQSPHLQLIWGLCGGAAAPLHLTLRDARPHVTALQQVGHGDLAERIADDLLTQFSVGFNSFVRDLHRIVTASRESYSDRDRIHSPAE